MSSPPETPGFFCRVCKRDDRFDKSWNHHLASIAHQRALSRQPNGGCSSWGEKEDRALVLTKCSMIKEVGRYGVVQFLTKKGGTLEEFICPPDPKGGMPDTIFCLMKSAESATRLLAMEYPRVSDCRIKIDRKLDYWDNPADSGNPDETNGNGDVPKLEFQLREFEQLDVDERTRVGRRFQSKLEKTFNSCKIYSYGTDAFGAALDSDNLRFCVDPYGKFGKPSGTIQRDPAEPMAVGLVYQIISTEKDKDGTPSYKFVSQYSTSNDENIPEISFKLHVSGKLLPCMLQFEHFLAVQKCRLLRFLASHDRRVVPLLSLIRHWGQRHQVFNETREGEDFEGYMLLLLMLFHLTKCDVIPSVLKLRELAAQQGTALVLDGVNIVFCSDKTKVPAERPVQVSDGAAKDVVDLLHEFFLFFSDFKFSDFVICPALGVVVERASFHSQIEEKRAPPALTKYYKLSVKSGSKTKKLDILDAVVVQDMFDLTENVTRAVEEAEITAFQSKCIETSKFLGKVKEGKIDIRACFGIKEGWKEKEWIVIDNEEEVSSSTFLDSFHDNDDVDFDDGSTSTPRTTGSKKAPPPPPKIGSLSNIFETPSTSDGDNFQLPLLTPVPKPPQIQLTERDKDRIFRRSPQSTQTATKDSSAAMGTVSNSLKRPSTISNANTFSQKPVERILRDPGKSTRSFRSFSIPPQKSQKLEDNDEDEDDSSPYNDN